MKRPWTAVGRDASSFVGVRLGLFGPVLTLALLAGCMRWSPFETDLPESERNKTAENIQRLAARPTPPVRYRIGLISDSHNYFDELAEVVDSLNARDDLELVVHLGDVSSIGLREEFRWALEQLERLDVPFFVVIGNHDALSNGRDVYQEMFGPYDFILEHGSARFVLFNSNTLEFGSDTPDLPWLEQQTRTTNKQSVFALTHQRPRHPMPDYDVVLRQNDVAMLVTGHLHEPGTYDSAGLPGLSVGSTKYLDYAILSVGEGPPEAESCFRGVCVRAVP